VMNQAPGSYRGDSVVDSQVTLNAALLSTCSRTSRRSLRSPNNVATKAVVISPRYTAYNFVFAILIN
jgi:hypothetical protein